jgi:CDP-glucose 4,6-dehydratase
VGQWPRAVEALVVSAAATRLPDASFWRGQRVLLTGHTGFKGSWLALWLAQMGAQVTGFALAPEREPNLFELARVGDTMDSRLGDLRDAQAVQSVVQAAQPQVVFHLAAQSLVRRSYAEPVATFASNVTGTIHLLEALRACPSARAVVVVTSDKCYENRALDRGYREDDALGGHDPYSASKGCAEIVTAAWRRSFFSGPGTALIASARAGNVIGGGDWAQDRLLPDLLAAFASGQPARIRHPEAVRPWQHVLEPLAGYLQLAEALLMEGARHATAWNFGPDADANATVRTVADLAMHIWGADACWQPDPGQHPHEAQLLMLDAARARQCLGWQPRLALAEAVAETVNWQRAFGEGVDAGALCRAQLGSYMARPPLAGASRAPAQQRAPA